MITGNFIGYKQSAEGKQKLTATNPATLEKLEGEFAVATTSEVNNAVNIAANAAVDYGHKSGESIAQFLRTIAANIEGLGDQLIERAAAESGLPVGRITGERGRTIGQIRAFADMVEEGSWVRATIDTAMPDRQPLPRLDHRKVLLPIGPVAVFGASNFPLAFSTAGGDTASALASGCPVVVKGHPSHLGTNALVAEAIIEAAKSTGMPEGVFSCVNGGVETGQALIKSPQIKAVAFTGSYNGGKAIMDLAAQREHPIPVFAEMGSINPVFITKDYLKGNEEQLASTLAGSITLGAGQFCTNPGLVIIQKSNEATHLYEKLAQKLSECTAQTMLNSNIHRSYSNGLKEMNTAEGVDFKYKESLLGDSNKASGSLAVVAASEFISNRNLHKEVFGPFSLIVECTTEEEFIQVAEAIEGQLTASIFSTGNINRSLLSILQNKVGRLIYNGVPTGVEVCRAMHHGGPFPSSSDSKFTSVGLDAVYRFVKPVCYQNFPNDLLPFALQNHNPLGIYRVINGANSKEII